MPPPSMTMSVLYVLLMDGLVKAKVDYTTQMVVSRIRSYTISYSPMDQIVETNLQHSILPAHTGCGDTVVVEVNQGAFV